MRILEIACDESGSEGENLVGAKTDVFAHASVRLDAGSATACIQEIRDRIRSPAQEYKANHLLREKHRPVLTWLLGPSGPMYANAHVHLIDKVFFMIDRVIDLLIGEAAAGEQARAMAVALYRQGRRRFGRERWQAFLQSSNDLMRTRNLDARASTDSFFRVVDVLRRTGAQGRAEEIREILELLGQARPRADAFRARLLDGPMTIPALDPLVPAIARAVRYWGADGRPIAIVHDQQTALTRERVAQLQERCRLASLRLVDSRSDPRVQVADFLAGVARRIASDELNHRGDAQLTALLRPYVDSRSIWGDARSWSLLEPEAALPAQLDEPR